MIELAGCDPLTPEYPELLRNCLRAVEHDSAGGLYVAGGAVRDWLLGASPRDLDLTLPVDAVETAKKFARTLGGTFVLLDAEEDVARVVWQGYCIDFSGFRNRCATIEEDLCQRDFTINALAVRFVSGGPGLAPSLVIDPTGGLDDLRAGCIRTPSTRVLLADPLRLLRAYRFMAALGFVIEEKTLAAIRTNSAKVLKAAAERISYELGLIMATPRASSCFAAMGDTGLLRAIFPELEAGQGLVQPPSHHLDVFFHNLEALSCMEKLLLNPEEHFPGQGRIFTDYIDAARNRSLLKWASLFHDVGKPAAQEIVGERITFYNHDRAGTEIFSQIVERLRWPREDRCRTGRLIALHMWPFHLSNTRLKTGITRKACLRLVKAIEDDLPGLFLLAMADSLAGQGPLKPADMEKNLADLFSEVNGVYEEHIRPVISMPPLLSGHDLIKEFALEPGPVFREIIEGLERAQVEGEVSGRRQAVDWVRRFLAGIDH